MENKNKKQENKSPSFNDSLKTELEKQGNKKAKAPATYVVLRAGYRVSDKEYTSPSDSVALKEKAFWEKVARFHSCGERVEIVEYDNRKHRVWNVE